MTSKPVQAPDRTMYFEDFRVGQVMDSPTHVVTEEALGQFAEVSGDKAPIHVDEAFAAQTQFGQRLVHGPYGLARFFGALHDMGIVEQSVIALLDTNWSYLAPIFVGDQLQFRITITRCRRTSAGDRGVVNRHVLLRRADGTTVQTGSTAVLVAARAKSAPGPQTVGLDFCGREWATELATHLNDDPEFTTSTRTFDGTIGLQAGDVQVHLRVYRGKVLEATPKAPLGATFTVHGTELAWTHLMTGPSNDYIPRALQNEFTVSGSSYDYLRLTKPLTRIWEISREMAASGTRRD